ncbi:MAG TPA: S9 family peptidase [Candidatus Tectomicrobia bacterium]|nr:S9 family peptidase [Candidatus Tectomicrobia bacterium]
MADTSGRPMSPQDLTRIHFISDPQVSPDGRRVAFVVTTLSEDKDQYLANIWMVDSAGGEPRRFTTGPKRDTKPRWSPDGTRLAFLSEREGQPKAQLYVMPAAGGEPTRLTNLPHGVMHQVWSPDGAHLALVARVGGWQEPTTEEERQKSKPVRVITTLKYKANGEGFIYDRRPHLFVVPADGGEPRQLTDGDFADADPAWSPDGTELAFISARHEERDYDNAADVWIIPLRGGEPRRLTDTAGPVSSPIFAPDGRTIAYRGHRYPNEAGRNMRVFTVPVAGGVPTCLTLTLDRTCVPFFGNVAPLWSADGQWITFAIEDQGDIPIYRVRADGTTAPERIVTGERQVTGLSASHDGALLAFTAMGPVSPAEVFLCHADGTGERPLTALNRTWKAEVTRSKPERFRYERDGHQLDGWVMRPCGFKTGQRYPALLNIHGGPHTQYGHNFFDEFQVYAGAGYAVIYTNPRGSQGYGEEFTRAVIGDWGGGDFADVMAGLDEALRRYDFLDPERMGVIGGSYGGFLTSWTVGHSARFKAACSERAVNNTYTLFGTSDIGHSFSEAQSGYLPWENMQWYIDHSPLTYAKDIATPLLIIHSETDLRCPMEQAEQLFVALKKQRKEVVFVRFPDEDHELSRAGKPRHRLERFRVILDWFAKYLQPAGAVAPHHDGQTAGSVGR